jgi:glucokinase
MDKSRTAYDSLILAGDVGGTNMNLALVGHEAGRYTVLAKARYKTQEEPSMAGALERFLASPEAAALKMRPEVCCLSLAGPVAGNRCVLTNANLECDGAAIGARLGIECIIINDFTAISYGIALLDVDDPEQITKIPHADGSLPPPADDHEGRGVAKAVVGAGTGLGVGYLVKHRSSYVALPTEGGHSSFPVIDRESAAFRDWLESRCGAPPGAELAVSGQGIANYFEFIAATGRIAPDAEVERILALPRDEWPREIDMAAARHAGCRRAIERFVELYAAVASNAALFYYPRGGLYLAGGIVAKDEPYFLEGNRFAKAFERNYKENISGLLRSVPLFIVRDYSISLYGAAHAALCLSSHG